MLLDTINVLVLIALGINIFLSTFLLFRAYRKNSRSIFYFTFFGYAICFWCISMFFYRSNPTIEGSIFWAKMLYFTASITPTTFLLFCKSFPEDTKNTKLQIGIFIFNLIYSILIMFTDLVIVDVTIPTNAEKIIQFGPLYYFYVAYIPVTFISSFIILYKKSRKYDKIKKNQILLILIGSFLTSSLAMISNLSLPTLGIFQLNWFGQVSTFIWLSIITFSIIRYQLFEIKVLIGRIMYFGLLSSITYCAFYLVIGLHLRLFNDLYNTGAYILGFAISIFYVILYNSINSFIRNKITSTLINPGFDPNETINELNKRLSKLLDYKSISEAVLTTLSRTIRSSYEALLLTPAEGSFQLLEGTKKKDLNISTLERCIYIWKTIGNYPIVYERVKDDTPYEFRNMKVWLKDVIEEMERSGIRVIVPLAEEKGIIGMLILGEKDADSMYSSIEVNFLDNLADTVSLAVNRSLLYTEVQDLNINLQKKVDSATADLKDKNVKLGDALTKLEEARRQERDMIDVMGHELRTPITIVRNALSVLDTLVKVGEGKVDPKKLTEYVDMSLESARRELALVETLLSATKIEATRMQVSREKVDMLDVIHDGIEGQKHQAEAKGLEIKFTKPEGEYYGYADRLRIQEVMDNLLSNAVKYTQQGYVEISINKIEKDGMIKVSIKDTGMGISEDDIKNLGKKFFRAKQYINEKEAVVRPGGTGLGLYVVFGLVDKMGGKIEIQSELGKGSIFSFIIPLYTNQKQEIITEKFSKDRVSRLDPKVEAELRKEEVEKTDDKNKSEDKILTP